MIKNEKEFYAFLFIAIKEDMKSKGLKNPNSLLGKGSDYLISRTQYFNIRKLSQGDSKTPKLSLKRIKELCHELGIKVEILFKLD